MNAAAFALKSPLATRFCACAAPTPPASTARALMIVRSLFFFMYCVFCIVFLFFVLDSEIQFVGGRFNAICPLRYGPLKPVASSVRARDGRSWPVLVRHFMGLVLMVLPQPKNFRHHANAGCLPRQGGFKNLKNRSRRRQSAHFSSIIGVLAPTAVSGYDFLKPPCFPASSFCLPMKPFQRVRGVFISALSAFFAVK